MPNDISTIAASLLKNLYQIPSFDDFKKSIDAGTAYAHPDQLLAGLFPGATVEVSEGSLEERYQAQLARVLPQLDPRSDIYTYLVLSEDFRAIKQQYLRFRARHEERYINALRTEGVQSYRLFEQYEDLLQSAESRLHEITDTFEFVSMIDSIYLQALDRGTRGGGEYVRSIVEKKLANYHIMLVLRLTQLGRSREDIERLFVPIEGIPVVGQLKRLQYHDVVTEIGMLVGLKPEQISVAAIETHLLNQELAVINKATYMGVGGERVVQYFERLRYFIADVKVAFAGHAMKMDTATLMTRLVQYDAK
jgi:hypothetical protein